MSSENADYEAQLREAAIEYDDCSCPTCAFEAGARWQAEQDHVDELEIAKVAAKRAARISELEAETRIDRRIAETVRKERNRALDKLRPIGRERDEWQARAEQAEAKLAKIRELHRQVEIEPSDTICGECSMRLPNGRYFGKVEEWPCPTVAILDGQADESR